MVKAGSLKPRRQRLARISFHVACHTVWGQQVYVVGSHPLLGSWSPDKALKLRYSAGDEWRGEIEIAHEPRVHFEYKYIIRHDNGEIDWEARANRRFEAHAALAGQLIDIRDVWCPSADPDALFLTAPFSDVIFRRAKVRLAPREKRGDNLSGKTLLRLQVAAPRVAPEHVVCVTGGISWLGEWDAAKALPMSSAQYPLWTIDMLVEDRDLPFTYKYVIKDRAGNLVLYEAGSDRSVLKPAQVHHQEVKKTAPARMLPGDDQPLIVVTDNKFRYPAHWRGAGIAVPVFSLRSKTGLGSGEFLDLKLLVDWAVESGMQLIQLLPVNDTSVSMTWLDSYPYSCMSVFALHPLYLNLEAVGGLPENMLREIAPERQKLNGLEAVNYEEVMAVKLRLARELYKIHKTKVLASPEFQKFYKENSYWLEPYAAFCYLRDLHGTSNFSQWGKYARADEKDIAALISPAAKEYDAAAFYFFLQFHLHRQFYEAADYAKLKRVVLKGDIPIGINKFSDSCWENPELFHMDQSAGAPPDPFSDTGQNWGFPTYDWEEMASQKYLWWRWRLHRMSRSMQMVRLDHVLGFFRIWEIPEHAVSGLMGHFNPAIPIWKEELEAQGVWDFNRLCDPYITLEVARELFGEYAPEAIEKYCDVDTSGRYHLMSGYRTQKQVEQCFAEMKPRTAADGIRYEKIKTGLLRLIENIVLFRDPERDGFHPRINMMNTSSFDCLDGWLKERLRGFYLDYFYHRQNEFWRSQAMIKLPVLKAVSNMLVCGEDLGMIPACVPEVMDTLLLLGLRIQRMPQETDREFGHPHAYPYLTVCTTSSHDMSTLRAWWEEDRARTQRYYNTILGHYGGAPQSCEPWICQDIIVRHLESPAMWAIFPMQDILGMSGELRRPGDPRSEQINEPANPRHYWKFRLHVPLEKLLANKGFSAQITNMVAATGRLQAY
jgi:4-alpha-glucanotransferase